MDLLVVLLRDLGTLLLNPLQQRRDVRLQLVGRVTQLSDTHSNDTLALTVVRGTGHVANGPGHVADNRLHPPVRHQPLRAQDLSQVGLVERLLTRLVAEETVELNLLLADSLEQGLLANGNGASRGGGVRNIAAFGADDGDLEVCLDGVGQSDSSTNDRAAASSLEVDVNFVLDGARGLADFDCAKNSTIGMSS